MNEKELIKRLKMIADGIVDNFKKLIEEDPNNRPSYGFSNHNDTTITIYVANGYSCTKKQYIEKNSSLDIQRVRSLLYEMLNERWGKENMAPRRTFYDNIESKE